MTTEAKIIARTLQLKTLDEQVMESQMIWHLINVLFDEAHPTTIECLFWR